jgi:hypothetical protein
MDRRTKLTDKEKKKIIADFMINNNYSETARLNGNISPNTVKALVNNNEEVAKKCKEKEEENTKDILEYIDTQLNEQKDVIKLSLTALKTKLKKPDSFTNVKDIATVYGIFTDKAIKSKELKLKEKELALKEKENTDVMSKLDQLLEEQKNA